MSAGNGEKKTQQGSDSTGGVTVPPSPDTPIKNWLERVLKGTGPYREAITIIAAVIAAIAAVVGTAGVLLAYFATKQDLDYTKHDLEYTICINKRAYQSDRLGVIGSQFNNQIDSIGQQRSKLVASAHDIEGIRDQFNELDHRDTDLKKSMEDERAKQQGKITETEKECNTLALVKQR